MAWPLHRLRSRWRHVWHWSLQRSIFERRHYRRLLPLAILLILVTVAWSVVLAGFVALFGGWSLVWQPAFAQNVLASLLVLPIGLAIGVVVGTLVQKHSLRFQVRHAGDVLADAVRLAAFKFIVFLRSDCGISIDIAGPVDAALVDRARQAAQDAFAAASWSPRLPSGFELKMDNTVDELTSCFARAADLRLAFPESFDLMERLRSTYSDIKAGRSRSDPLPNTALIVLNHAADMIREFE